MRDAIESWRRRKPRRVDITAFRLGQRRPCQSRPEHSRSSCAQVIGPASSVDTFFQLSLARPVFLIEPCSCGHAGGCFEHRALHSVRQGTRRWVLSFEGAASLPKDSPSKHVALSLADLRMAPARRLKLPSLPLGLGRPDTVVREGLFFATLAILSLSVLVFEKLYFLVSGLTWAPSSSCRLHWPQGLRGRRWIYQAQQVPSGQRRVQPSASPRHVSPRLAPQGQLAPLLRARGGVSWCFPRIPTCATSWS